MIHEVFDFFPFNLSSGPDFLAFYFVFAISALIAASQVRRAVGVRLDRSFRAAPGAIPRESIANESPYRASGLGATVVRQRLTVGWIPTPDEHWTIAYLEGGQRGVANTLISAAMAAGWLACLKEKPGTVLLYQVLPPESLELSVFHARLTAYGKVELSHDEVRYAANSAAGSLGAGIERDLTATGMVRSATTLRKLSLIMWLSGALVLGVGLIRFARALELERPASLLVVEMLFFAGIVVILALTTSSKSTLRDEYVTWLRDSTLSLCSDVSQGRRCEPIDVSLAVAVGGASVLASSAALAVVYGVLVPPPVVSVSSSSSSSGGSSCSSSSGGSSCGGGGGSSCGGGGGSSCGGGGGCGG